MHRSPVAVVTFTALALSCSDASETRQSQASSTDSEAAHAGSAGSQGASSKSASSGEAEKGASALELPPLEDGFKRFVASAVDVPSGTTDDWIQWVDGPTDQDYDVVALKGAQSIGGHHALLLAVSEKQERGFTRKYTERDQLTGSTLGGIGAEGAVAIPDGVVFRVKKGSYLAIQAHYLNTSERDINGQTYIDMKVTPRDPSHVVAGLFANTSLKITLPAKAESEQDVYCNIERDLKILRMTNHMHYAGKSTYTEYTDPAGVTHMLKKDDAWTNDWALTPNYDNFTVSEPLMIPAGSTLHTHCVWNNTADKTLTFPEEMCVFATNILGEHDISCIDGKFVERGEDAASAPEKQPQGQGDAAAADAGAMSEPGNSGGACTFSKDKAILEAEDFQAAQRTCGSMCLGLDASCATACLGQNTELSTGCAACSGAQLACAMMHCIADCTSGFDSPSCMPCLETNCGAAYHECSGI